MKFRVAVVSTSFLAGTAMAASPASAAASPSSLCSPANGATISYPSTAALEQATVRAETLIERARGSDRGGQSLEGAASETTLDLKSAGAAEPDSVLIARYCSAAGEIMRLAPDGSQRQAQDYLQTAVRFARSSSSARIAAQSAYRLALVSVSGSATPGVRGASRSRRSGTQLARAVRAAETTETTNDLCGALTNLKIETSNSSFVSLLALDCAARIALDSGQADLAALSSLRFGRFALSWADFSEDPQELLRLARERTLSALPVAASVADESMRAELVSRLARTYLELGASDELSIEPALAALRVLAPSQAVAKASLAELEARIALRRGQDSVARAKAEQAILAESARPLPYRLPELFLLLAEIDPGQRARLVSAAYAALTNIRPRLPRLDPLTEESAFALYMRRVFESAAEVELAGASLRQDQVRIASAQQVIEAFREAELQSAVGSECLSARSPMSAKDLALGEAVLYPLIFPDRVELIYAIGSKDGTATFRRLAPNTKMTRRDVARLADAMASGINRGDDKAWRAASRQLYDLLVAPVSELMAAGSTLTIIPDGALRGVPFAALLDPDNRFVVERFAVSVAPALAYSQPGQGVADGKSSILAASLEREVVLPAGIFPALHGTAAEAKLAAASGAPGKFVADFTRKQLVDALSHGSIDVLHLATHASFNGRSDRAFVVANGDVIRISELRDLIANDRIRGDTLALLVLSACETAVGDDEASMGLAGAAVQAGAYSALASLWQVDDAGTAKLMQQFYRNYGFGQSRAQSLRNAQVAMIKEGGESADPYVWAAFTLIGAWR